MSSTLLARQLRAPLPLPRSFTLLDAATISPQDDETRWKAGVGLIGYPPGPAHLFDPCATGTFRLKEDGGVIGSSESQPFTVYLPISCTARSVAAAIDDFRQTLDLAFVAHEATQVEIMLATGGGFASQYLGDADLEVLGGGAVTPTEGLALLEAEIPYGNGIIHVPPETATYWISLNLIAPLRGQMRTLQGTPVAIGYGYRDVVPDGEAVLGAGEQWAFATGPIEIFRDAQPVVYGSLAESLDRSSNDVTLLEERDYLLIWVGKDDPTDTQIQAGVLIDRIP